MKTLSLLVGGNSKVTNQDLRIFMNTPFLWNSTSFIGATRNSICSWKNVRTFYCYPYHLSRTSWKFLRTFLPHLVSTTCKLTPFQKQLQSVLNSLYQKQPSRGVFKKICPENMHAANFIYRRTPMPKCNLLNSHFDMGVLLQICCIFSEHL